MLKHGDCNMVWAATTDNHYTRVEGYAESVSGYIRKFVEDISKMKIVSTHTNKRPRMSRRAALKAQNSTFRSGEKQNKQPEPKKPESYHKGCRAQTKSAGLFLTYTRRMW